MRSSVALAAVTAFLAISPAVAFPFASDVELEACVLQGRDHSFGYSFTNPRRYYDLSRRTDPPHKSLLHQFVKSPPASYWGGQLVPPHFVNKATPGNNQLPTRPNRLPAPAQHQPTCDQRGSHHNDPQSVHRPPQHADPAKGTEGESSKRKPSQGSVDPPRPKTPPPRAKTPPPRNKTPSPTPRDYFELLERDYPDLLVRDLYALWDGYVLKRFRM